jgi:AraC-like DNA-binding protein
MRGLAIVRLTRVIHAVSRCAVSVPIDGVIREATGLSVTNVAADLGYSTTSAFIGLFRRAFGETPSLSFTAEKFQPGAE